MIVGTTSQLPAILLMTGIGIAIAVLMHFIQKKAYKYLLGGFLALAADGFVVWRMIESLQKDGFYMGILGIAFLGVFLLILTVYLFASVKGAK